MGERNKKYQAFGKSQTLKEWAREYNIQATTLRYRHIKINIPLELALIEPLRQNKQRYAFGEYKTLKEWCKQFDQKQRLVLARMSQFNWKLEDALTSPAQNKFEQHIDKVYHGVKVLDVYRGEPKQGQKYPKDSTAICLCSFMDCGNIFEAAVYSIRSGHIRSCGCFEVYSRNKHILENTKHGYGNHRLFHIWKGIMRRCYQNSSQEYYNYGGRGITVCGEWLNKENDYQGLLNFIDWSYNQAEKQGITRENLINEMHEGGNVKKWSIDRINVNGNYEPSNCRWATASEQANNTRRQLEK